MPAASNPAVHRQKLAVDIARLVGTEEADRRGDLRFQAVAVERDGVVVVGADLRRVHGLRHRRVDRARRNGVDPDAEAAEFHRLLLGEVGEPGLARPVGDAQRAGAHARNGSDVDDAAAAAVEHQGYRRLDAQKRPGQVDREYPRPVFKPGLHDRPEDGGPGIVDEGVEAAEAAAHCGDRTLYLVGLGDIGIEAQRRLAGIEVCHRRRQRVTVDVEQRDAPAVVKKPLRGCQTDPPGGARHQNRLLRAITLRQIPSSCLEFRQTVFCIPVRLQ